MSRVAFLLLVLSISSLSFGQKITRFFKKDLDVSMYQNQELRVEFICKTSDSSPVVIRSFFDSKDNKYIGYNTLNGDIKKLDDSWVSYIGIIQIPDKAAKLDLAILTSAFPETISIANLMISGESEEIFNTSKGSDFEVLNYNKSIDNNVVFNDEPTTRLTIGNLILYGNNTKHGKYAELNGIDFYYEIYGTGEPVLLLHGNNESINSYRYQIDKLKESYKVIAVDSRCQGRSSCNRKRLSYTRMANDMNALLNFLNIGKVNIIGWSDGGNTGFELALHYPERVKSLITMGANIFPEGIDPDILKHFKHNVRMNNLMGVFNRQMRKHGKVSKMCLKYPDISPADLSVISIPALILAGENDVIIEEHTELIANSLPNSELYIFPNHGHNAPIECPEKFNNVVVQFLQKNR
jgi:pimeloyl-ACP methyl ester carboxylesterase